MEGKKFFGLSAVALISILAFAGCGGSTSSDDGGGGGGATASELMSAAFTGFNELTDDPDIAPCLTGTSLSCECPGGGSVTVTGTYTYQLNDCKTIGGLAYSGTINGEDGVTISGSMGTFGGCASATASDVPLNSCDGSIVAICSGENTTCSIVDASSTSSGDVSSYLKSSGCTCGSSSSSGGDSGGGDSGGGTSSEELKAAFTTSLQGCTEVMSNMSEGVEVVACVGGGSITVTGQGVSIEFSNCKSSDGLDYTGTLVAEGTLNSGTMTTFGECTDVTVDSISRLTLGCSGTLSGTCGDETGTCVVAGTAGSCTCD